MSDAAENSPGDASAMVEPAIQEQEMDASALTRLEHVLEALLLSSDQPLSLDQLHRLLGVDLGVTKKDLRSALDQLGRRIAHGAIELMEVGSGFRIQVKRDYAEWVGRLWQEKPPRYSRALLETLALVCYRQPITRGEIEQIRGVAVSTNTVKLLEEREWVRVVGHRDVPGKPALFGTTKAFLDYFGLKSLDELPPLAELKDISELEPQLPFDMPAGVAAAAVAQDIAATPTPSEEAGEDAAPEQSS